eukprot:TRINITY_DN3706_c0_g1_i1.p1 TRINITY_DN3706_c0_g1~~TRINITY_DN3706_c0_g1_i1.p1  ORF type:complete len:137 (+),score=15.69 TRINITY_DN3706_c0_g1_i1:406-816(+)
MLNHNVDLYKHLYSGTFRFKEHDWNVLDNFGIIECVIWLHLTYKHRNLMVTELTTPPLRARLVDVVPTFYWDKDHQEMTNKLTVFLRWLSYDTQGWELVIGNRVNKFLNWVIKNKALQELFRLPEPDIDVIQNYFN